MESLHAAILLARIHLLQPRIRRNGDGYHGLRRRRGAAATTWDIRTGEKVGRRSCGRDRGATGRTHRGAIQGTGGLRRRIGAGPGDIRALTLEDVRRGSGDGTGGLDGAAAGGAHRHGCMGGDRRGAPLFDDDKGMIGAGSGIGGGERLGFVMDCVALYADGIRNAGAGNRSRERTAGGLGLGNRRAVV